MKVRLSVDVTFEQLAVQRFLEVNMPSAYVAFPWGEMIQFIAEDAVRAMKLKARKLRGQDTTGGR